MGEQDDIVTTLSPEGSSNSRILGEIIVPRILNRPKINFYLAALYVVLTLSGSAAAGVGAYYLCKFFAVNGEGDYVLSPLAAGFLAASACLIIVLFFARKAIPIWFVRVYQRYAKADTRLKCLYTPSCSEYMILSIQKYGTIRGIIKGIKRIKRCHLPNGGEDYP